MFVFHLGTLVFAGGCGWLLYDAFRKAKPATVAEWAQDSAIAVGVICAFVSAITALWP